MTSDNKSYATANNPTIEASIGGLYRFANEKQAKDHLESLTQYFVTTKEQPNSDKSLILWIKNFKVTAKEKDQGYIGNFALLSWEKTKNNKYTIHAEKLESEITNHPQKKRTKQSHPNWGHPILRSVKKKKIYPRIEVARNELQLLHEEYPETSIPLTNKIYLMVYSKDADSSPIKKYVMEIKPVEEGGFLIEYKLNTHKASPTITSSTSTPKEPPQGYFTSLIEMKRKK